jgi:16S rRNA (guanine527-N7)-methyltransferase
VRDDPAVRRWLDALVATPGLTAVAGFGEAWALHVEDALTALPLVGNGSLVDVGSGGGSPGIPLAAARPELHVVLLEASRRKADFLRTAAAGFGNVEVVCARAEEFGRGAGRDRFETAIARALAPPEVAAEWCLPLVRPGGRAILYTGEVDEERLVRVARELAAEGPAMHAVQAGQSRRLVVLRKVGPTPERFPRRPGAARKRPLA